MIERGATGKALGTFEEFVSHYDTPELRRSAQSYVKWCAEEPEMVAEGTHGPHPSVYLQIYLHAWLSNGAVEWSGGSYVAWTRIVVNLADAAMRDADLCNYISTPPPEWNDSAAYARPIVGIHDASLDGHDFLDPDLYAVEAYRWDRRDSGLLQPVYPY